MEQYLIDTNVISDYFSASLPINGMSLIYIAFDETPTISIITQIELLCWNTDAITSSKVKDFIEDSSILNITTDIISKCVSLRKGKKIKTPDAIIAATALSYNFTLITNNEKDSTGIHDLKIINPHNL